VHTVGHKKQKPTKVTLRHPRKPKKITWHERTPHGCSMAWAKQSRI
jgi:hypothetical protein